MTPEKVKIAREMYVSRVHGRGHRRDDRGEQKDRLQTPDDQSLSAAANGLPVLRGSVDWTG